MTQLNLALSTIFAWNLNLKPISQGCMFSKKLFLQQRKQWQPIKSHCIDAANYVLDLFVYCSNVIIGCSFAAMFDCGVVQACPWPACNATLTCDPPLLYFFHFNGPPDTLLSRVHVKNSYFIECNRRDERQPKVWVPNQPYHCKTNAIYHHHHSGTPHLIGAKRLVMLHRQKLNHIYICDAWMPF